MDRRDFLKVGAAATAAVAIGATGVAASEAPAAPQMDEVDWIIPTKRRDVWAWAKYFVASDPEVAHLTSSYAHMFTEGQLGQSGSVGRMLTCTQWDILNVTARELAILGNAIVYVYPEVEWARLPAADRIKRPPEAKKCVTFIDPNFVDIENGVFFVYPDEMLKWEVWNFPSRFPKHIRQMIYQGRRIPLDSKDILHLSTKTDGTIGEFGKPYWYSAFKYLACKAEPRYGKHLSLREKVWSPLRDTGPWRGSERVREGQANIVKLRQLLETLDEGESDA